MSPEQIKKLKKESFEKCKQEWLDYPSQDNEGYQPDRGGFKVGWHLCLNWIISEIEKDNKVKELEQTIESAKRDLERIQK